MNCVFPSLEGPSYSTPNTLAASLESQGVIAGTSVALIVEQPLGCA